LELPSRLKPLEIIAIGLLTLLFVILLLQIILRYVGSPFIWVEEFSIFVFTWLIFLGVAIAFRRGDHLLVDLLYPRLQKHLSISTLKLLRIFLHTLTLLFFLVFCIGLCIMTVQTWPMFAGSVSGFRVGYIYLGVLLAAVVSSKELAQSIFLLLVRKADEQ
jgi:TRAP-type C4-dicarboxylate transport system permease small subunit